MTRSNWSVSWRQTCRTGQAWQNCSLRVLLSVVAARPNHGTWLAPRQAAWVCQSGRCPSGPHSIAARTRHPSSGVLTMDRMVRSSSRITSGLLLVDLADEGGIGGGEGGGGGRAQRGVEGERVVAGGRRRCRRRQ